MSWRASVAESRLSRRRAERPGRAVHLRCCLAHLVVPGGQLCGKQTTGSGRGANQQYTAYRLSISANYHCRAEQARRHPVVRLRGTLHPGVEAVATPVTGGEASCWLGFLTLFVANAVP